MKKTARKKLSLDKIKIAKLDNPKNIMGGGTGMTELTGPEKCPTHPVICSVSISTKTGIIRYTAFCNDDN